MDFFFHRGVFFCVFLYEEAIQVDIYTKMLEQLVPKKTQLVPKRKDFLRNEKILNTRGD